VTSTPLILPAAGARRLSNQIGRAFRGTFEAAAGLRTITRSVARQLLGAGESPEDVARAIGDCVARHPDRPEPSHGSGTSAHSMSLIALTRDCVNEVALDMATPTARPLRRPSEIRSAARP
jgi:hypothetical protein